MPLRNYDDIAFGRTRHDLMRPPFVVDPHSIMRETGRQIAWDLLTDMFRVGGQKITVTTIAAVDAPSVLISPLVSNLPKGSDIYLGPKKFVRLTADALAGDATLTVAPLATALAVNDTGYAGGSGDFSVPAGEEMDLLADGRIVPSVLETAGVTCYGIMETSANGAPSDAATGYGIIVQGQLYENLLPRSSGTPKVISSTHKTELLARGGAWMFFQYADNT